MTGPGQLELSFDAVVQSTTNVPFVQLFAYLPDVDSLVTSRIGAQIYSGAQVLHVTLGIDCAQLREPLTTSQVLLEIRTTDRGPTLYATSIPYIATWCR